MIRLAESILATPRRFSALHRLILASLAVTLAMASPSGVWAAEPSEAGRFLESLSARAIDELVNSEVEQEEKESRFRELLRTGFDIPAIGRFVLGRYWRQATEEEQKAFLGAFETFIVQRFTPLFSAYRGDTLEVGEAHPHPETLDIVTVASKLVRAQGEPVSVDWRIRRIDNQYKIFDVVAEGISMGITLRSEFTSILQRQGGNISALTEQMRRKNAEQAMAP